MRTPLEKDVVGWDSEEWLAAFLAEAAQVSQSDRANDRSNHDINNHTDPINRTLMGSIQAQQAAGAGMPPAAHVVRAPTTPAVFLQQVRVP